MQKFKLKISGDYPPSLIEHLFNIKGHGQHKSEEKQEDFKILVDKDIAEQPAVEFTFDDEPYHEDGAGASEATYQIDEFVDVAIDLIEEIKSDFRTAEGQYKIDRDTCTEKSLMNEAYDAAGCYAVISGQRLIERSGIYSLCFAILGDEADTILADNPENGYEILLEKAAKKIGASGK